MMSLTTYPSVQSGFCIFITQVVLLTPVGSFIEYTQTVIEAPR